MRQNFTSPPTLSCQQYYKIRDYHCPYFIHNKTGWGFLRKRSGFWAQVYLASESSLLTITIMRPFNLNSQPGWSTESSTFQFSYYSEAILLQFSRSVVSDSSRPRELQHARPPCPSPTPGVHPNSCPSSQWCHPAITSSVVPFSSCPQSLLLDW